jgi:predicted  nucleic acid-binding Zn-ribbon protein
MRLCSTRQSVTLRRSVTVERDNLKAQVDTLTTDKASTDTELAAVKSENERLNGELDTAQVSLKAAQDEAAALKADIASRDEASGEGHHRLRPCSAGAKPGSVPGGVHH